MIIFKYQIKKLLKEAEEKGFARGYAKGCLDGYRNCETHSQEAFRHAMELYKHEVRTGRRGIGKE